MKKKLYRTIWNGRIVIIDKEDDINTYFHYEDDPEKTEYYCLRDMWTDSFFIEQNEEIDG